MPRRRKQLGRSVGGLCGLPGTELLLEVRWPDPRLSPGVRPAAPRRPPLPAPSEPPHAPPHPSSAVSTRLCHLLRPPSLSLSSAFSVVVLVAAAACSQGHPRPPPSSRCAPSACAPSRVQLILLLPLPLLPLVLPALLPMPLLVLLLPLLPSLLLLLLLLPLLLPPRPSAWPPKLIAFVISPPQSPRWNGIACCARKVACDYAPTTSVSFSQAMVTQLAHNDWHELLSMPRWRSARTRCCLAPGRLVCGAPLLLGA